MPKANGWRARKTSSSAVSTTTLPYTKARVSPQVLFARFASAVFPMLGCFIQKGQRRMLKLATDQEERWFNADDCEELGNSAFGRSKVASKIKKRQSN